MQRDDSGIRRSLHDAIYYIQVNKLGADGHPWLGEFWIQPCPGRQAVGLDWSKDSYLQHRNNIEPSGQFLLNTAGNSKSRTSGFHCHYAWYLRQQLSNGHITIAPLYRHFKPWDIGRRSARGSLA